MFVQIKTGRSVTVTGEVSLDAPAAPGCLGATWRSDGKRLTASVDRYGFRPLYYARLREGVAVSDTVGELLKAGADSSYDDEAIAVFLRLGYFIGTDTPFRSIRAFPVGGVLRWSPAEGLTVSANPIPSRVDQSIGKAEALDGYVQTFRQAVASCLPSDPARSVLPLSGGRDSRHIALELHRNAFRPGLVITQRHFSYRSDEDARVAGVLASALGWHLTTSDQVTAPLDSEHEKNRILEGMTQEHAWFLPTATKIREGATSPSSMALPATCCPTDSFVAPNGRRSTTQGNGRSYSAA